MNRIVQLYLDSIQRESAARRESDERILAILAGESATLFGKPVEFTVTWPDGPPMHKTPDEMREYCAKALAVSRGRAHG